MSKTHTPRLLLISLLLAVALLAACKPTPTPLSQRDLAQVILQKDDLPAGFDLEIEGKPEDLFPNADAVHTGVVNARSTIIKTPDDKHVFSNGILIYESEDLASSAYQSIILQTQGNKLTLDPIGDETFAIYNEVNSDLILNTIHIAMILWRSGPAVVFLSSADSLNQPDPDQMPNLARLIQSRLVGEAP